MTLVSETRGAEAASTEATLGAGRVLVDREHEDQAGPVTIGIDIGTTSVKAVAVDATGEIVVRARLPHRLVTDPPGTFEHVVDDAWHRDVLDALARVASGREVAGVCVAAMVPSLTAVDESEHVPGLLYGDRRGVHPVADPSLPGDGGELLTFLRWLVDTYPDATGYWPAQAVANRALCGEGVIDEYTALTAFPLFDLTSWDAELAIEAGTTVERLPRIVGQLEVAGHVRDGLAGAGAVLAGGTVDGYAEQIVSGANEPGDVLVICGTTLITWMVTEQWCSAPGTWSIPHHFTDSSGGRCLVGGPSNAGGLFQDHVARLLGCSPGDGRDRSTADPADVPVWLPYVRGERTPLHRRDLRAALFDVGLHHGPAQVLRAAHEAAGFVVRHHVELAAATGTDPKRIVATGGGTRSAGLMQAFADVTGLPVDVAANPDGAARGAAYLARCAAGLADGVDGADAWARTGHRVEPRAAWREWCETRYRRFRDLTAAALQDGP
jgi:xylulokinase